MAAKRLTARRRHCFAVLILSGLVGIGNAFMPTHQTPAAAASAFQHRKRSRIIRKDDRLYQWRQSFRSTRSQPGGRPSLSSSQLDAADVVVAAASAAGGALADYAPAATSLFNNMKLPAAVVTAGMISLGFATGFPALPDDTPDRTYSPAIRDRCASLKRFHVVLASISVTSEILVVMWAAVEVNQLTERVFAPSTGVWDLIQRDCDLAWSAVNSHFVLGIMGFVSMLAIRAYVMLLAAEASAALIYATMTGTGAALCLMISVVNRGVESGGGEGIGYGKTILDLFGHYVVLLTECATNAESPGPLEMAAIVLELASIGFAMQVIFFGSDKLEDEEKLLQEAAAEEEEYYGSFLPLDLEIDVVPPAFLEQQEKMKTSKQEKDKKHTADLFFAEQEQKKKKASFRTAADADSSVGFF